MTFVKETFEPNSTFIKRIEYSYSLSLKLLKISEIITIYFCDGKIIEYKPPLLFPPNPEFNFEEFYVKFISSESVGKFWHKEIKNKLEYKRLK